MSRLQVVEDVRRMIRDYISEMNPADVAVLDRARKMIRDEAKEAGMNPTRPTYAMGVMHGVRGFLHLLEAENLQWFLDRVSEMRGGDDKAFMSLLLLGCATAVPPSD